MGLALQEVATFKLSSKQFFELAFTNEIDGIKLQQEILLRRESGFTVHLWILSKEDKLYGLEVAHSLLNEFAPLNTLEACEVVPVQIASYKFKSRISSSTV